MDAATIGVAHHIGDRALAWLDGVRSLFALDRDIPHHQIDGGALKSLAELALAAELVLREAVAGPRGASLAEGLFDFVWRQFDDGELLYQLQRHTPPRPIRWSSTPPSPPPGTAIRHWSGC